MLVWNTSWLHPWKLRQTKADEVRSSVCYCSWCVDPLPWAFYMSSFVCNGQTWFVPAGTVGKCLPGSDDSIAAWRRCSTASSHISSQPDPPLIFFLLSLVFLLQPLPRNNIKLNDASAERSISPHLSRIHISYLRHHARRSRLFHSSALKETIFSPNVVSLLFCGIDWTSWLDQ